MFRRCVPAGQDNGDTVRVKCQCKTEVKEHMVGSTNRQQLSASRVNMTARVKMMTIPRSLERANRTREINTRSQSSDSGQLSYKVPIETHRAARTARPRACIVQKWLRRWRSEV